MSSPKPGHPTGGTSMRTMTTQPAVFTPKLPQTTVLDVSANGHPTGWIIDRLDDHPTLPFDRQTTKVAYPTERYTYQQVNPTLLNVGALSLATLYCSIFVQDWFASPEARFKLIV